MGAIILVATCIINSKLKAEGSVTISDVDAMFKKDEFSRIKKVLI